MIRSKLSYANVVATIALFLALGGGAVYAASKIRTGDLAKNAVKRNILAPNSIEARDFRKKSLISNTATGGGQTTNVPATPPATGFPLPLSGKSTFKLKKGEAGLVMAEAQATLASIAPPAGCNVSVQIFANGEPLYTLGLDDAPFAATGGSTGAPYTDVDSGTAPAGLTGGNVAITAQYDGDPDCSPTSRLNSVKIAVQKSR